MPDFIYRKPQEKLSIYFLDKRASEIKGLVVFLL